MAVVGRAEVVIRALTTQLKADIQRGLQQAANDAEKQGGVAGDAWVKGFKDRISANLAGSIDFDVIGNGAAEAGTNAGAAFGENFNDEAKKGTERRGGLKESLSRAVPDAVGAGGAAGNAFSSAFNVGASAGGGGGGGGGFLGGFFLKLLAFLPIITTLIAALSALASGLFAVGAAAGVAAAGGLALLPGVIGALIAVIGVAVLAFGGLGSAVKELGAEQKKSAAQAITQARAQRAAARAVENAADAVVDAQERVGDAQERVADSIQALERARRDAARGAVDAARRVIDAEDRIVEAQERAQAAQEGLTQAREDAAETLEDLQLSLRGAVLGEQEATLRLARARQEYQETLNNPNSNALDRAQARIDLQQAELALDQARDRRDDVTIQTEEANKAGIEGSEQVKDAKEEIDDANKNLADSERELTRAREDQAQQAVDAAERISDAQEAVRDAYKGVQDAVDGVADAQQRYADALENQRDVAAQAAAQNAALREEFNKLSPAGQRLAILINGLRGQFRGLKQDVQEAVLPAVERLVIAFTANGWFEVLRDGLVRVGEALGDVIDKFTELFSTSDARDDLAAFFRIAAQLTRDFGGAFVTVLRALLDLTAGAEPFFTRFGGAITDLADRFAAFIDKARNDGSLKTFFDLAFDSARAVGDALGSMSGIIKTLAVAAAPFGIALLDAFTAVTDAKNEFFKSDEGQGRLNEFFTNIVPNMKAVMSLLGELVAVFIRVGENPAVKEIADQLRTEFLPALERAIDGITENLAPAVFRVVTSITEFIASMSNSSVIKAFITSLATLAAIFAAIADVPILRELLAVFAVFSVGVLVGRKLISVFRPIIFAIKVVIANLRLIGFVLRGLAVANPFGAIILGITLLITGIVLAYRRFEGFRNVVDTIISGARAALEGFIGFIVGFGVTLYNVFIKPWVDLFDFLLGNSIIPDIVNGAIAFFNILKDGVMAIFDGIKFIIETIFNAVAAYFTLIFTVWKTIFTTGFAVIKAIVETVINAIKAVIVFVFNLIVNTFRFYFNVFQTIFRVGWDVIKTIVSTVFNAIKDSIGFIFGLIRGIFDRAINGLKTLWSGFWGTISSVATSIFGGVRDAVDRILGGIKSGFETTVSTVKRVWEGFREAVSAPIRSVIDVAYNKGIVKFWNRVAGTVGAPELKEVKFAKGGTVPGYAPGQDRVRALLSPGEGILVPEAVRGLARQMRTTPAKAIQAINSQWTSRVSGPGGYGGRFSRGGYVSGSTRNAWGGPVDFVKNKWNDSVDWVLGQLAKTAEFALNGIYKIVDTVTPANAVGDLMRKAPRTLGDKILGFFGRKDKESESSGGGGVGGGKIGKGVISGSYQALVRVFKDSGLAGVVTSTKRQARFPGDTSNHMRGLAADFSGAHGNRGYGAKVLRDIFHLFADNYGGGLRELILAGAPFNIKNRKKVPGYAWGRPGKPGNHWNHVHAAAMAQGGTVLPRPGGTLALLAEAGKAESVVDTGLLNERLRDLADARDGSSGIIRAINQQNAILERIGALGGIRIDKIEARTTTERDVGMGIARELRGLAFELGQ